MKFKAGDVLYSNYWTPTGWQTKILIVLKVDDAGYHCDFIKDVDGFFNSPHVDYFNPRHVDTEYWPAPKEIATLVKLFY